MPSIRVHFDEEAVTKNISRILDETINSAMDLNVREEIAGEYAMRISKYVPYKTGQLVNSADIVADAENGVAIRYSAKSRKGRDRNYDYAQVQYETPFENRTTPDTYDHWNKHLTTAERKDFYEACADIISESMKHG